MRKRPTTEEQTQPIPRETLAELAAAWRATFVTNDSPLANASPNPHATTEKINVIDE